MIQYLYVVDVIVLKEERTLVALSRPLLEDCDKFYCVQQFDTKKFYLFEFLLFPSFGNRSLCEVHSPCLGFEVFIGPGKQ
jgi:hypothetical protein